MEDNIFLLKDLLVFYNAVELEIERVERPTFTPMEKCLQYNEERLKEKLEKARQSEEYKYLIQLKNKILNIRASLNIENTVVKILQMIDCIPTNEVNELNHLSLLKIAIAKEFNIGV